MNQWYPIRHWIFDEVYKVRYLLFLLVLLHFSVDADCGHGNNPCEVPGPPGADGQDGEQGPQGDKGDTGMKGMTGAAGAVGAAGVAGVDGKDYMNSDTLSDDEISELFAGATAMAGLDFDSTTTKTQVGLAVGYYDGEDSLAIGIGKVWDSEKMGDVLFSLKTTVDELNGHRPVVGAAIWKF